MVEGSYAPLGGSRPMGNGASALGLLGVVSIIWGLIFPLTNIAVHNGLTPITVATFRILIAATVLLAISAVLRSDPSQLTRENLRRLAPIALLLFAVPYTLMAWSQYYISSSYAVIVLATIPLLTALFMSLSTPDLSNPARQRQSGTLKLIIKLLPGFLGIVLLMGESALTSRGGSVIGSLAAIASSISCAKAIALMSRLPALPAISTSKSICLIAALLMLPICIAVDVPWTLAPSAQGIIALLLLGLVCTGLSSTLYIRLTSRYGAVFAALSFYVSPISGLVLSAVLLGETIGGFYISAITLVLISVYLVSPPLGPAALCRAPTQSSHRGAAAQSFGDENQHGYEDE